MVCEALIAPSAVFCLVGGLFQFFFLAVGFLGGAGSFFSHEFLVLTISRSFLIKLASA